MLQTKSGYCIFFFFLFGLVHAKSQSHFTITGKIINQQGGFIFLSYQNPEGTIVIDSCLLQNGNFCFTGKINEPTLASLQRDIRSEVNRDSNAVSFYIEPRKMTALVEKNYFNQIKIRGSRTQTEYQILQKKYNTVDNDSDSAYEELSKINYRFVTTHPNSYVSTFLLSLYKTSWPLDSVRLLYSQLNSTVQKSFYGKQVFESINEIDSNSAGKMAKFFTAIDFKGDSINLSNFKGKYVLLDFWASWCVPCREGTPHLIQLFKKYHEKGLEIIGISDDYNIEAWKIAVENDKVSIWYHILSGINTHYNNYDS